MDSLGKPVNNAITGYRLHERSESLSGKEVSSMPAKRTITIYDEQGRRVAADSPYARRFAEIAAASRQVGNTAEDHLTWLIRFASDDPATWHPATRTAYGDGVLALTGFAVPSNCLGGIPLPSPLSAEDVGEVHRVLSRFLRDAVNGEALTPLVVPGYVKVGLVRLTRAGEKPARWGTSYRYQSPLGILHVLRDLILRHGDRLVACRQCETPFLAVKKQQFCTAQC